MFFSIGSDRPRGAFFRCGPESLKLRAYQDGRSFDPRPPRSLNGFPTSIFPSPTILLIVLQRSHEEIDRRAEPCQRPRAYIFSRQTAERSCDDDNSRHKFELRIQPQVKRLEKE